MRPKVYIAGPYTQPDPVINTRIAMEWWHKLWDHGFAPYCPHLCHFLHLQRDREYYEWLEADNEWVTVCRALFRFQGPSTGADAEEELAKSLNIPVFYDFVELCRWRDLTAMPIDSVRLEVFREIGLEREFQDRKWGGPNHGNRHTEKDWLHWLNEYANGTGRASEYDFETRMKKVAALAVAALEQRKRM